jgi:hypothetical protein
MGAKVDEAFGKVIQQEAKPKRRGNSEANLERKQRRPSRSSRGRR